MQCTGTIISGIKYDKEKTLATRVADGRNESNDIYK